MIYIIYLLTNRINGMIYVGQTYMTLEDRMGKKGNGYCNCPYLFNALNKYGVDNFYDLLPRKPPPSWRWMNWRSEEKLKKPRSGCYINSK